MKNNDEARATPSRSDNFSEWYTSVVLKAGLADYAPVRGCMVIRPYGYALWENMQTQLDRRLKQTGHQNAYFPTMIPESFFQKEARHVAGFSPEAWWVTHRGADKLEERLALRPTSEAIINAMFARWVKSYRDLPLLINQWCNIFRAEKSTRLFLRTSEFLWQEGHTLHRTEAEAEEEALRILDIYIDFLQKDLALAVLYGLKPESEKFAGAERTYTMEAMMPDGQALQAGTSHNLGQGFARAFEIKYLDVDNKEKYPWGTSWGVTTRLIGALVMAHGDDHGLFLPPHVAPIQVVVVPILYGRGDDAVLAYTRQVAEQLSGLRVKVDEDPTQTAGWKFNQYELLGVPVRVEVGPRDVQKQAAVMVPRSGSGKRSISFSEIGPKVRELLEEIQQQLYASSLERLQKSISEAEDFDSFRARLAESPGFVRVFWCGDQLCERRIMDETKTTPRVMVAAEQNVVQGPCIACRKTTGRRIHYARTY